ncbi:MAG: bifunctional (p)ppGpp synthetase/guanosine-3',5'-bis(diphosphate) 3'-pyrophosphohydrolase [Candidatus Sericytochromatia bacterium]|nr:bifunctional (p)ppGpp synthetase/guanosine-3',5'-bis(diphosphate) 3'-pyrophosphohydrolase [Candidatus Sericytochromatia bacterium]
MQDSQPDSVLKKYLPLPGEIPINSYPPYVASLLEHLVEKMAYATTEDIAFAERAFFAAYELHKEQKRKSGEPYIIHPYEVALILTELNASGEMIAAGFLHDILEDTDFTHAEMTTAFGETVTALVDGVTKLSKFSFSSKEERQAENFRRMFMAMAQDIRVVIIKLADRLHNMRTLDHMSEDKQKKIAQETLDIFAPLAHRLGIGRLKWELEDLCLRYLYPDYYWSIAQYIAQKRVEREEVMSRTLVQLKEALLDEDTEFFIDGEPRPDGEDSKKRTKKVQIFGRPKNFYSIYNKISKKQKDFKDIYDYFGIRVLVDSEADCYSVLGMVHSIWKPIPGRFKDYIAMPKQNMYQSLHTTVISETGHPLEVQIRTFDMDRIADFGIAAHWKYKQGGNQPKRNKNDLQLTWLRQLIDWQKDLKDAEEFMSNVKSDLFEEDIYIFTPRGDVHVLPKGSTAIDFAYRIHTHVGNSCVGAKMNGRMISLPTPLENGAQVEIMTSKNGQPSLDWINFVVSNQAKNNIRKWFKKERREDSLKRGKELLEAEFGKENYEHYIRSKTFEEMAQKFNRNSVEDLIATVGYGEITPKQLLNRIKTGPLNPDVLDKMIIGQTVSPEQRRREVKGKGILIGGEAGVLVFFPHCCLPVPGEPIVGVVTRTKGVAVHSKECSNLGQVNPKRFLPASWGEVEKSFYPVELQIYTIDRRGLLKDVVARMSDSKINILAANVATHKDKTATIDLVVEVTDIKQLQGIIQKIRAMSDVLNVVRIVKTSKAIKQMASKKESK